MNRYSGKGLTGLANLGNTCFINSFLQCLSHTYELNDFLDNNYKKNEKALLLNEWNSLRKLMWSDNCIIAPKRFLKCIQQVAQKKNKLLFTGYIQNDVSEFMSFILEIFHRDLKKDQFVGYNQTYKSSKKITIAILGIGYADGISRKLSNKGRVYYKKNVFRIIGRVSMDSLTIDITKHKKHIKKGIYMDLINEQYDIEKIAKDCSTISNEILTSISNRVKRIYL